MRMTILVSLATIVTGCSLENPPHYSDQSMNKTPLQLEASVSRDGDNLEVKYKLTNSTDQSFCVLDVMYDTKRSGERVLNSDSCYVAFNRSTLLVDLSRSMIPVPKGLKVEYPEIPYGRVLAAQQTLRGSCKLKLPLLEASPYLDASSGTQAVATFKKVQFSIGAIEVTPDLLLNELIHVGPGVLSVMYADAASKQVIVGAALMEMDVECTVN